MACSSCLVAMSGSPDGIGDVAVECPAGCVSQRGSTIAFVGVVLATGLVGYGIGLLSSAHEAEKRAAYKKYGYYGFNGRRRRRSR